MKVLLEMENIVGMLFKHKVGRIINDREVGVRVHPQREKGEIRKRNWLVVMTSFRTQSLLATSSVAVLEGEEALGLTVVEIQKI